MVEMLTYSAAGVMQISWACHDILNHFSQTVMAAPEAAIHPARACAPKDSIARGRSRDG
jgi:hypothetical protein